MSDPTWLPADWQHPTLVELSTGHHLRPIHPDDTELDLPAVMGSRDRLWARQARTPTSPGRWSDRATSDSTSAGRSGWRSRGSDEF
jgi:hypothetical protein